MEISQLLVAAREAARMTQAQVAAARHVTRGAQSQLELPGARPAWDTIHSFAEAIDASVTVQFALANGAVVSGQCAGVHKPSLADDLFADADQARTDALAAGRRTTNDGAVIQTPAGYGQFPTVQRLAAIIEPLNWTLLSSLTILMSMAVAEGIGDTRTSHFSQDVHSFLHPFPKEDDAPVYDVTTQSQIALNALLDATRHASNFAVNHVDAAADSAEELPVRDLIRYLNSGAPGASEVPT